MFGLTIFVQMTGASHVINPENPNCGPVTPGGQGETHTLCCPEWAEPVQHTTFPFPANCEQIQDCPKIGNSLAVSLPPVLSEPRFTIKPLKIGYDKLDLRFTSVERDPAAFCSFESSRGSLPVDLLSTLNPRWQVQIGTSTTMSRLDYFKQRPNLQICDPSNGITNNCLLTAVSDNPDDVLVKWSTAGFDIQIGRLWHTQPWTFYVFASKLGVDLDHPTTGAEVNKVEKFLHTTLSNYVKYLGTRWLLILDPPSNDILLTDPQGNVTGMTLSGQAFNNIPGSLLLKSDNISGVMIGDPEEGRYKIQLGGRSQGPFALAINYLNFTNNFSSPYIVDKDTKSQIQYNESRTYYVSLSKDKLENLTDTVDFPSKIFVISAGSTLPGRPSLIQSFDPLTGNFTIISEISSRPYFNGRSIASNGTHIWYTSVDGTRLPSHGEGKIHIISTSGGSDLTSIPDPDGAGGRGIGAMDYDNGSLWAISYLPSSQGISTVYKLNADTGAVLASCDMNVSIGFGGVDTLAMANGRLMTDKGEVGDSHTPVYSFFLPTEVGQKCKEAAIFSLPIGVTGVDTDKDNNLIATNGTSLFGLGHFPYSNIQSSKVNMFKSAEDITIDK